MTYKPVGVDENSKFPPRVEARLRTTVASEVTNQVPAQVVTALAADPTPKAAAVAAVDGALEEAGVVTSEELPDGEFGVRREEDSDFILYATKEKGITKTKIEGNKLRDLTDSGWVSAVIFEDPATGIQRVKWGVRVDGSVYPQPSLGITPVSGPDVSWPGDSLTAGWGGEGTTSPSVFASLSGLTTRNMGVGGELSSDIAARNGGNPLLAIPDGQAIPASGVVNVTLTRDDGAVATRFIKQGTVGLNPATIAGVQGNLLWSETDSRYQFTRLTAGSTVAVTRPQPVIPQAFFTRAADAQIIQLGRNNLSEGMAAVDRIMEDTDAIISHMEAAEKRFLVVGVLNGDGEIPSHINATIIAALTKQQRIRYGRRFVDIRRYLIDYGLKEAGITPTAQDLTDISNDIVPSSLRVDNIHLNAAGYTRVGTFVFERYKEMGWL